MSAIPYPSSSRQTSLLLTALRSILIAGLFFILSLFVVLIGFEGYYSGRIYPGVNAAGVDLSGLTPQDAANRIAERVDYPQKGHILFYDGSQTWNATPADLGFYVDPQTTATNAFKIGRHGLPITRILDQANAWTAGVSLAPTLIFDQRTAQNYLLNLAHSIDRPIIEANLGLDGANVVVHSGQVGRALDIDASLALLSQQLISLRDGAIHLPVRETAPVILDVNQQADLARKILSAPLTLSIQDAAQGDPGPWTFDPPTLASMLAIEKVQVSGGAATLQVAINTGTLRDYLEKLSPTLARDSKMPRFTFNNDSHQIEVLQHAVIGRSLDVEATIQSINTLLAQGEHNVNLVFKTTPPAVTDNATAEQLGIKELIHSESSYFYGSSAARVQNITTAAAQFNGVLVAPGEIFSMADTLGDISLDNGYAEALIILGNQTIQGVGGGVCQVSTTLFRTVFFAGFPVVERHAHAYRVLYYEKVAGNKVNTNFAGLDATVYVPLVDFKFKNDTPNWLLMETSVDPASSRITWQFYSTSDGRSVDYTTTGLTNITPPPDPIYRENPALSKGTINQVDWAVQGADVTIKRTVTKDGAAYIQDSFYTHFQPWGDVYEYGPGTDGIPTPTPAP